MKTMFYILKGFTFGVFFGTYTHIYRPVCIAAMCGMVVFMLFDLSYFKKEQK